MRWNNIKRTAKAAAALVAFAACGQQAVDNRGEDIGDIRGIEELGNTNLTVLISGDASFNSTTGVMAVTLQASETLVQVSLRASDSAILLNGIPVVDTTGTTIATSKNIKRMNLTVGADGTTVIFDYFNGTFNPGIKAVTPLLFGTAGTVVAFGAHVGGAFKVRGTSGADTFYVGQDTAAITANVLISFSAANPDIEVTATTMPSLGFNLGVGNDTFDAFSAKGGTVHACTFPVSVHGGVGNDSLIGGTGADTLYGDEGINVIDESLLSTAHVADKLYGLNTPASVMGLNTTTVTYATWAGSSGVGVQVSHLATLPNPTVVNGGLVAVTDYVDDSVTAVIGSPKNDTLSCSQLTDTPCYLQGGAGDDVLSPGLSILSTHYLYGGDGNDSFVMTQVANHVSIVGGNVTDISTVKNSFVDTVDYSTAISAMSALATTISMNGTAPTTCVVPAIPASAGPPCAGVADTTPSGQTGSVHTDIRNDVTVAKCPTGINSAGVACTVKANNSGDTIYSGLGADHLTGGTGDDIFVIADFYAAGVAVSGTSSKVIAGGASAATAGNDTADFSLHTGSTAIRLDCILATCANSGSPFGQTAADFTAGTTATTTAGTQATAVTAFTTAYGVLVTATTNTADDDSIHTAVVAANTAAQTAATDLAAAIAAPSATTVASLTAAVTALNTAVTALTTANTADQADITAAAMNAGDPALLAKSVLIAASAGAIATAAGSYANVSEGITLEFINNTVCPASGTSACAVTTNVNADVIDFNGDGAAAGSSLTCNSSDVTVAHAAGLVNNCGI